MLDAPLYHLQGKPNAEPLPGACGLVMLDGYPCDRPNGHEPPHAPDYRRYPDIQKDYPGLSSPSDSVLVH